MINIIVAEDHNLVRHGIKLLLQTDPNICVVGEADSGVAVLKQLAENTADIILTDLYMAEMSGMQLVKEMKERYPAIQIIILTMVDDHNMVSAAFNSGVQGYLLKDIGANELVYAINHVYNGGTYVSADLSYHFLIKQFNKPKEETVINDQLELTSREKEILALITDGFTNIEISEMLFLSKRTIEGHRQALIDKTKCRNTASLV